MLNKIKSRLSATKAGHMEKTLFIILLFIPSLIAQEFKVINVKGDVKYLSGTSEVWTEVKEGEVLKTIDFISTGKNSSLQIKESGNIISIDELSASFNCEHQKNELPMNYYLHLQWKI